MSKKPVPKKQQAKSSSRSRHSKYVYLQRERLGNISLSICKQCGEKHRSHYACEACGYYGDKLVLNVKTKAEANPVEEIQA